MKLLCSEDYNEMSRIAADQITQEIHRKPDLILGLATGSSPLETYRCLQRDY